jgi:hypothetical protein
MKDTEWVPSNPSVDMTVENLANLRHQLKNVSKNLTELLVHEWPSALDITNELHRLQEAVNEYSLNQTWSSVHARVDGTMMMVTTPEIRRVSQMIFENILQLYGSLSCILSISDNSANYHWMCS